MIAVDAVGHSGGLALLWRNKEDINLCSFSKNHIDATVKTKEGLTYRLTGVYGEPDRSKRHETWSLIRNLAVNNSIPWCLIGDMNNVLAQSDKRGGNPYPQSLLQGFQDVLNDCDLADMHLNGYQFTWERGFGTSKHIEVRLDRALVTPSFFTMFKAAKLSNLEVSTSDHCPIWLEPEVGVTVHCKKTFHFENAWLKEPMCYNLVEEVWCNSASSFYEKLTHCSEILSVWGKEITGDFKGRIYRSKRILQKLKGRRDPQSVNLVQQEKKILSETYAQQEVFWRQRSKQLWLQEGDQNSKYFHAATKNRRKANQINSLQNSSGDMVSWGNGMEQTIEEYFTNLFSATNTDWNYVTSCMVSKITPLQNDLLLRAVDEGEVKAALFNMHPDKSPGPDGMTPRFYQKCWNIVKTDIVKIVRNFFETGVLDVRFGYICRTGG